MKTREKASSRRGATFRGAFGASATNTFAIKLSYWFAP
jgi:hypothetical protein